MNEFEYRPFSIWSVVALVISIGAIASFVAWPFLAFTLASMAIAAISIRNIRRYSLSGTPFAVAGIIIAGSTLIFAPMWHTYLFRSEALPGHIRIDFAAIQISQTNRLDQYANQEICFKGYMLAPMRIGPTRTFCLSPDGDDTKPENSITVELPSDWDYQYSPVAVSGILTVNPSAKDPAHRYVLNAKAVCTSNTLTVSRNVLMGEAAETMANKASSRAADRADSEIEGSCRRRVTLAAVQPRGFRFLVMNDDFRPNSQSYREWLDSRSEPP